MTPERYQKVGQLYHGALELPPERRSAFLDDTCGDDRELRQEVESLLSADDQTGDIGTPAMQVAAAWLASERPTISTMRNIGRYEVLSLLGRGGMGEVYLAHDATLGRKVAVKVLRHQLTTNPKAVARFEQEARAASSLNHPNIVTIYEIGEVSDGRFIAMEFVDGQSLAAMIGQPFSLDSLVRIGRQLAQALSVAHAVGIVHRDIKPENIMVRADGYVKVLDFGVARLVSSASALQTHELMSATNPGVIIGTPRYMSPEQARGEAATTASDVFALGVVLYELATGKHPFEGHSTLGVLHAIASQEQPEPSRWVPALPVALERLILRMLEKEAPARPAAAEVETELTSLAAGTLTPAPVVFNPSSDRVRPQDTRSFTIRARRWMWLTGMTVVAVVTIVAAYVFRPEAPSAPVPASTTPVPRTLTPTQITAHPSERLVNSAALSPDGKYVSYDDPLGVHIKVIDTGESQLLPNTAGLFVASWLPDSTRVMLQRFEGVDLREQWSISLLGTRQRMPLGEPSPDGTRVADSSAFGGLVVGDANGGNRKTLVNYQPEGFGVVSAAWSPTGRWLIVVVTPAMGVRQEHARIERVDPQTGARATLFEATETGYAIRSLALSRNGRIVFARSEPPPRMQYTNLWSFRLDEAAGERIGDVQQLTSWNDFEIASISMSADGKRLSMLRTEAQADVHISRLDRTGRNIEAPERLTMDDRADSPYSWAPDSRALFFWSNRLGTNDIYRQAIDSDAAELAVGGPGSQDRPRLTPDQQWLVYRSTRGEGTGRIRTLNRIPVEGGPTEEIMRGDNIVQHRCGQRARCVVTLREDGNMVVHELDWLAGKGPRIMTMPQQASDRAVSPDGQQLAFLIGDTPRAIRLVDLRTHAEREIQVKPASFLVSLDWSPDGRGFWCVDYTASDTRLWHISLNGSTHLASGAKGLRLGWVIPSPDGKRLALSVGTSRNNVWMLEGF